MGSNPEPAEVSGAPKRFLRISEVVAEYGNSAGFWRKQILHRRIPFVKAGRTVKLDRSDLEAWHGKRRVGQSPHPAASEVFQDG